MKGPAKMAFVLAIGFVVTMLIAGCEEEQQLPNTKKSRLIGAENIQLKKELKQRDREIERQKQLHKKEIEKQKLQLEKCLQEKKGLEEQLAGKFGDQIDELFKDVGGENLELREEIKNLKAQIEKLKEELDELKAKAGPKPL